MYKRIEDLYKKKSPYNKIKIKTFRVYLIIVILLLVFNIANIYLLMLITVFGTVFIMKSICEKELKTKLYFSYNKKDKSGKFLDEIICDREKKMFKDYCKKENLYNEKSLKCLISHYRSYIKPKMVSDNFWSIIAIIVSVALAFVTKEGFDFNSFERAMPYLISLIFITVIINLSIKQFSKIKTFFKGEDGMNERLEGIFSELYIECINENEKTDKKKVRKNVLKKSKNNHVKIQKNRKKFIHYYGYKSIYLCIFLKKGNKYK